MLHFIETYNDMSKNTTQRKKSINSLKTFDEKSTYDVIRLNFLLL